MAKLYDEYQEYGDTEPTVEYSDEEETPKKKKGKKNKKQSDNGNGKNKGKWAGRIIALGLGFCIGVGSVFGTAAGAGLFVAFQPIDRTVGLVDTFIPADVYAKVFGATDEDGKVVSTGILNEKYAELKVKDLLSDVMGAVSSFGKGNASLGTFDEISPKVGSIVDSLLGGMDKYGIPLDKEKLLEAPFKAEEGETSFAAYFKEALMNASAGDVMRGTSGDKKISPLLMAICYGEEGVDYSIDEEGNVVMLNGAPKTTLSQLVSGDMNNVLNKVAVDVVIDVDTSDSYMCSIAYGKPSRYTITDGKVTMNQVLYTYKTEEGKYVFYDDSNNKIDGAVQSVNNGTCALQVNTGEKDADGNAITETQYVQLRSDGTANVFADAEKTQPILYKKNLLSDLRGNSKAIVDNVLLKDALSVTPTSSKLLLSLVYGSDYKIVDGVIQSDVERTIGDLRNNTDNILNDMPLSSVLNENRDSSLVMYLLYGRKDVHYQFDADNNPVMLQKRILITEDGGVYDGYGMKLTPKQGTAGEEGFVDGYTIDTVNKKYVDVNGEEYSYADARLAKVTTQDDKQATVYYLSNADGKVYYQATTLGDLSKKNNAIDTLSDHITIGELMDEDDINENIFLKHIKDKTIASIPTAINNLTINEVYAHKIYKNGVSGELNDAWYYLLTVYDPTTGEHVEREYKITEFDQLIQNMQDNVHIATLSDLQKHGMVVFKDQSTLTTPLKTQIGGVDIVVGGVNASEAFAGKSTLGDLTVDELTSYLSAILKAINHL